MIQANELRIGNWMNHNGRNLQVQTIDTQGDGSFAGVLAIEYSENDWYRMTTSYDGILKPIQLTPEILEKAGFEVREWEYGTLRMIEVFLGKDYIFNFSKDDPRTFCFVCKGEQLDNRVEYLHQLQNLYHALTGKELEINIPNPA